MAKTAKLLGVTLLAVGLAVLIGFGAYVVRDERFSKATLLKERNPGNVLYESQYFVAATIHLFLIAGAVGGAFLAIHGVTFLFIGKVAAQQGRSV
jgi:hypothetical protein